MERLLVKITIYKNDENKIKADITKLNDLSKRKTIKLLKDFIRSYKKKG